MQVLEDHDQWRFRSQRLDRFGDLAQHPLLRGAQQLPVQRIAVGGTEEPWHLHQPGGRMLPQEGDQPVAPSLAAEPAEGIEQRQIWFLSPVRLDALASRDPDARVGGDALEKGLDHPRLADARLAGHEDDLSHAAPRRIEPCPELAQSGLPAHEVGRPAIAGAAAEGGGHRRRPRHRTARRSRVDVGDVGDEPVPPPVHRGHEPGCADLIAESLPDLPNADLEHCVAHHGPGPDALEQHILSDELTVALNEAVQHGKRLGRQVNFRRASPQ